MIDQYLNKLERCVSSRALVAAVVGLMSYGFPTNGNAQQIERIAAIVNDEVISTYDVRQRISLVLSSSGIQPTTEVLQRVQAQVLRTLVDEKLQLQEAAKYEVEISEQEINDSISRLAEGNGLTPDDVVASLKQNGISIKTLLSQIEAELAWNKLVQGLLSSRVSVNEESIDQILNQLVTNANKPQYLVSEIFLEVPSPAEEQEIAQGAVQLIQQMQQGVPFTTVAQQFSSSASAAQGGDIGWVQDGELAPLLNDVLRSLQPGQVSSPVRTLGGFSILALRDRRVVGGPDPLTSTIDLQQIMIPLARDADADTVEKAREGALSIRSKLEGCGNIESAVKRTKNAQTMSLGQMKVGDLAGRFRSAVATLKVNEFSDPIRTDTGLHILVVCAREQTDLGNALPSRVQIEDRLYGQQLSMLARRHLRDLRRDSTIEMR